MEPKRLYRSMKAPLPESDFRIPLGKAQVLLPGEDLTLITYGAMVPPCLEAAHVFKDRYSIEVIDLRTLSPLDQETLVHSVQKTGRAVVVHEAPRTLGMGAEISARLMEAAFLSLRAPVRRVTGFDTQMPYYQLENYYLPNLSRISQAIIESMTY